MAVPDPVAYSTVTSSAGAADRVTVKVALPSDSPTVTLPAVESPTPGSENQISGPSLSVITKSADVVSALRVAPTGLPKVTVAVSVASSVVSSVIGIVTVPDVSPADMVSVPVVPV